jgi:hypothetical protein
MPAQPFEGCMHRLNRAVDHRNAFGEAWAEFLEPHPYRLWVQVDDDGNGRVGIKRYAPIPPHLPLLIGEFLYELRAALDNCLYEMAIWHTGQDPPPDDHLLQFPIYDTPAAWKKNLHRLRHLSDEHRTMLERIQPYNAQRQDLNCLRMLNRMAAVDRHRTLHVVGGFLLRGGMLLEAPEGAAIKTTDVRKNVVIDEDAVIALFRVDPWTPGQEVQMYPDLVLEVEIAEMASDRPWGSLSRRLYALHKAVSEYIEVLAAYAQGFTEPDPDARDKER